MKGARIPVPIIYQKKLQHEDNCLCDDCELARYGSYMLPGFDMGYDNGSTYVSPEFVKAKGPCEHIYVDVGFHFTKLVCKLCDKEKSSL
jgi:hypothetical protein